MNERDRKHSLAGNVRHQGVPVSGVEVMVYSIYGAGTNPRQAIPLQSVTTGTRGEFSFSLPPGPYRLEVVPSRNSRFLKSVVEEINITENTVQNLSLTTGQLLRGSVATKSGDKVTGCEVLAIGIEPSSYWSSSPVEKDGTYSLVLPKGKFHIASRWVNPQEGDHGENHHGEANGAISFPYLSTTFHVLNLAVDDDFDLELPTLVKFTGELKDVFGQPVEGAIVRITPNAGQAGLNHHVVVRELELVVEAESNERGIFEVMIEPGTYDLEVVPSPKATHFGLKEQAIKVAANLSKKFTLEEGHKVKGEVTYENEPLSHCLIRMQDVESNKEYIGKSDHEGRFALGVPGGNYKVIVTGHPKHAPTVTIDGAQHAGLAPWTRMMVIGSDTELTVQLSAGTSLNGKVCDDAGHARAGMPIYVCSSTEKRCDVNRALASAITDVNGRYSVFLSPGDYILVVHQDFENATAVKLEKEAVNLDINWHGWCSVKFEIAGEDGQKIPRCQVKYAPYGQKTEGEDEHEDDEDDINQPSGYVLTGEDGTCTLTLPCGVYKFHFNPPDAGSYEPKHIRQLSISSDLTRRIALNMKS